MKTVYLVMHGLADGSESVIRVFRYEEDALDWVRHHATHTQVDYRVDKWEVG